MPYGPADTVDPGTLKRALVIQLRYHGCFTQLPLEAALASRRFAAATMTRLLAFAIAAGAAASAHALQLKDDRGVTVSLERPAQRIVC
ncbi:MAG TPA: hypothetical protein VJA26_14365, partial [Gammaproteobacteria bacterium]|nr:hypothetical protein [Gammaproteobacteria bacterium]